MPYPIIPIVLPIEGGKIKHLSEVDEILRSLSGEPTIIGYIPLCKNCHFWTRSEVQADRGSCICPKFKLGYEVELEPDEVQVEDDEGWGFMTTPEFGCIHFEVKNANP